MFEVDIGVHLESDEYEDFVWGRRAAAGWQADSLSSCRCKL